MSSVQPAPIYEILANQEGKANLPWILFFNQLYEGDSGTLWTPTFQNLGSTGGPSIEGKYYRISDYLTYFTITITPSTDTSSVAGTTYCDNFPLNVSNDGICGTVTSTTGVGLGVVQATTDRIYTPTWTNVTTTVTVMGIVEAR